MWPFRKKKKHKRSYYAAAGVGRLLNDWNITQSTPHEELKASLKVLRVRVRDLARNNDYVNRYLKLVKINVVGSSGIGMQSKIVDTDGTLDTFANDTIEDAWKAWGKHCDISGRSWVDCQLLAITTFVRDGEIFVRKHTDKKGDFWLEFVDPDLLDEEYNRDLGGGRRIEMGIEYTANGRPAAYHIFKGHPSRSIRERQKIPADQVIHCFLPDRVGQRRGVSALVTAMERLQMLAGYEEAELVAARTASAKMGFFTSPDGASYDNGEEDADGAIITKAEPGTFEQLPEGMQFQTFDPTHPTTAFAGFEKAILRGIASGLNVSYVSLANDLEGVSYSSIRQGELADRDAWRLMQQWFIRSFIEPVYEAWLDETLLAKTFPLPYRKFDKFNSPSWQPRSWQWVDPLKEVNATKEEIRAGLRSISEVILSQGRDPEEVFAQLAADKQKAEEMGLTLDIFTEVTNGPGNTETN